MWGGAAPGGFDCSGLTSWAYKQAGLDIPRVAADQTVGRQVSYEELQPGDLVLWSGHAAMYAGDGMMIEAGSPVQMNPVRTENLGMTFRKYTDNETDDEVTVALALVDGKVVDTNSLVTLTKKKA